MMMQPDETYYIVDMICWRGYSLYDCTAEFRFFWVNSKDYVSLDKSRLVARLVYVSQTQCR